MTVATFRRIALGMPQAAESEHMGHPDFRVNGKIFATLFTREGVTWGMVKLKPEQQREFIKADPQAFAAIKGAWGRRGCTQVCLKAAERETLKSAMFTAWCNTAPKKLIEELGSSGG